MSVTFFFQAEDGIRDGHVTGVQTCALPICVRLIGPNCPGIISPGKSNVGITPADITGPGRIGLVSKSGTLTYQMMYELRDIGFTTAIGIGGDPVIGTTHIDALEAFEADPDTELIVMIGEIGGRSEEHTSELQSRGHLVCRLLLEMNNTVFGVYPH